MSTLLLRLEGPMQSWGIQSRFTLRDAGLEPSKSGVIGLLCAALGKPRQEQPGDEAHWPTLSQLSGLRMAVRVDRPGSLQRDFHTAGGSRKGGYGVAKASGAAPETVVSNRYYLAGAAFLVGLESDDQALLERLHQALAAPYWPLYLGRKSFVPGAPVYLPDGLQDQEMESLLKAYHPPRTKREQRNAETTLSSTRMLIRDATSDESAEIRPDVPIDFATRRFGLRYVLHYPITVVPEGGGEADVSLSADR